MSNIDTIGFGEYLKVFHETYIEGVERFVEPDWHGFLDRYPRLPSRIKGYVSTTFGVAFRSLSSPVRQFGREFSEQPPCCRAC